MVTATVGDNGLAGVLQVPFSIQGEIREKTSTSADFREGAIEYYVQYSPRATWAELAGRLYLMKCGEALAAARRFIKRTPGKCVAQVALLIPIIIVLSVDSFQRQLSVYQTSSTLYWRESGITGLQLEDG